VTPTNSRRIAVVGATSSGKTTLAREIAHRFGVPHVELDALRYRQGWVETSEEVFRGAVTECVGEDQWVIDGNYEDVRDLIWLRTQLLVWIDFPLYVTLGRLLRRTFSRLFGNEEFAGGNREQMGRVFGKQSILIWAIRSHRRRRRQYEELLVHPRYAHLKVVRLRSPSAVRDWLADLPGPKKGTGPG